MCGGQGLGEDILESKAMADYALDKGGVEKIILEQKSVSTVDRAGLPREVKKQLERIKERDNLYENQSDLKRQK
ncbi:hypothetical protein IMSAGC011_02552 [Lachnospiraceae bacterium]|nr:hypothetical protein IMSAGC011_02552 [Lachnospiraceae bacterium]